MRVLYLSPAGALGGAERSLLDLIASLRACRADTRIAVVAAAPGSLLAEVQRLGAVPRLLPMPAALIASGESSLHARGRLRDALNLMLRGGRLFFAARRYAALLREEIDRFKPDVIHSNGIKMHLLTRLLGWQACPIVWHMRDLLGSRPLTTRALRWATSAATAAYAISNAVARDVAAALPSVPVELLLNAVDTQHFSPGQVDPYLLDRLAGLAPARPGTLRIGLIATFARWKGHDVFLEAAASLMRTRPTPPVRFFIVGGPIYQTRNSQWSLPELRTKAEHFGLQAKVGFIPFQDDPVDVYRALDVVVHASTQPEPFGRTIAEAMACGRAVIATQAGGAAELFQHGADGLGVPPGDPQALAGAIHLLAEDARLRSKLGVQARTSAQRSFNRRRLGPQAYSLYEALLGGHRRQAQPKCTWSAAG